MPKAKKGVPTVPPLECAVCGAQMRHLADLQLTAAFAASRVYRCFSCNHVVKQAWPAKLLAEIHETVVALQPDDRPGRAKVNEAVRQSPPKSRNSAALVPLNIDSSVRFSSLEMTRSRFPKALIGKRRPVPSLVQFDAPLSPDIPSEVAGSDLPRCARSRRPA